MTTPEIRYGSRGICEVIQVTFEDGRTRTVTERQPGQLFGPGENVKDVLAAVKRGIEETQQGGRVKDLKVL